MRRTLILLTALLAGSFLIAGCGSDSGESSETETAPPFSEVLTEFASSQEAEPSSASIDVSAEFSANFDGSDPQTQILDGKQLRASVSGDVSDEAADLQFEANVDDRSLQFDLAGEAGSNLLINYAGQWYDSGSPLDLGSDDSAAATTTTPDVPDSSEIERFSEAVDAEGTVEEVDGEEVYAYDLSLNPEAIEELAASSGTPIEAEEMANLDRISEAISAEVAFYAETGYLQRVKIDASLDAADFEGTDPSVAESGLESAEISLEASFSGWGEPVEVELPPANEVRSEDELSSSLGFGLLDLLGGLAPQEGQN